MYLAWCTYWGHFPDRIIIGIQKFWFSRRVETRVPRQTGLYIGGGGGGGGGRESSCPCQENSFFSNIVFEFAELFLVDILVRNHSKIDN